MALKIRSINYLMLARVAGWLLMIEAIFMLIPLITSAVYRETDLMAFIISVAVTAAVGAALTFGIRPSRTDMGKHEGFMLTASVWVLFSIFGMLPFLICDMPISFTDAFFESMSGFTTTGASILPTVENLPRGIIMWRCVMQWVGGMGIILFTLAVLPMLNHSGGMQMFNAEVTGITHDKLRPRVSQTAKGLWGVYFALTAALILLLWVGPMDFYESVCQAFSGISTGGFSTRDASIKAWNSTYVEVVMLIFMFFGGTSFALIYRAGHGDFKSVWRNEVFRTYILAILVLYAIFVINILANGQATSVASLTIDPLFLIVSTVTSTGYTVNDFEQWGPMVLGLMFLMMFSGACAGSTSGGAKIDRLLLLAKNLRNELYRCMHPNAILNVRVNDKIVAPQLVAKVIAFLCLFVVIVMFGGLALAAMGVPLVDAFFSSFSCISNTGLGSGITGYGYGENYEIIPDAGKWLLSLLMVVGRLELFTVLVLFTPGFWKK